MAVFGSRGDAERRRRSAGKGRASRGDAENTESAERRRNGESVECSWLYLVHAEARRGGGWKVVDDSVQTFFERRAAEIDQ